MPVRVQNCSSVESLLLLETIFFLSRARKIITPSFYIKGSIDSVARDLGSAFLFLLGTRATMIYRSLSDLRRHLMKRIWMPRETVKHQTRRSATTAECFLRLAMRTSLLSFSDVPWESTYTLSLLTDGR